MTSYWRSKARPIIQEILATAKREEWTEPQIKKALRDAYPFGPRQYHPYKIWCDEIRGQRGLKRAKPRPKPAALPAEPTNQEPLF